MAAIGATDAAEQYQPLFHLVEALLGRLLSLIRNLRVVEGAESKISCMINRMSKGVPILTP
jgi:hypothetical protein